MHDLVVNKIAYSDEIGDGLEKVKAKKEKTIRRFRKLFDNRLIIVDEVQNMMSRSDKTEYKQCAKILKQIVRFCKYTRFLFLSATPVYNNYDEIIWLANLMNMNDNRALIKKEQVFDKKGDFVKGKIYHHARKKKNLPTTYSSS